MRKRKKMNRKASKKLFSQTAGASKRNAPRAVPMRGGIRL